MKKEEKEKKVQKENIEKDQKYGLDALRKNCMELFGVTCSTFDGATNLCSRGLYTIKEVAVMIEMWTKKGVK